MRSTRTLHPMPLREDSMRSATLNLSFLILAMTVVA